MAVTAKFFASLRETLDLEQTVVNCTDGTTVADVWKNATKGADMPPNTLIAVNMEYVDTEFNVSDGDEVAFFPPVSGG
ncbi:MAG: MoaD/ThiS family protein [Gammaproteobacteria bacterium]|nr:MoaD/ThiS family protein [Gammaproteobacteria bacterium]MDH5800288.1 MoaD/ThiS family protein [Gammaproteobacteria bacterium]